MPSPDFPCALDIRIPFPSARLATIALSALQPDPELSPLVRRHLSLSPGHAQAQAQTQAHAGEGDGEIEIEGSVLEVRYQAATNRMLRVAVNSFLDALKLSVEVMECMDKDVLGDAL